MRSSGLLWLPLHPSLRLRQSTQATSRCSRSTILFSTRYARPLRMRWAASGLPSPRTVEWHNTHGSCDVRALPACSRATEFDDGVQAKRGVLLPEQRHPAALRFAHTGRLPRAHTCTHTQRVLRDACNLLLDDVCGVYVYVCVCAEHGTLNISACMSCECALTGHTRTRHTHRIARVPVRLPTATA